MTGFEGQGRGGLPSEGSVFPATEPLPCPQPWWPGAGAPALPEGPCPHPGAQTLAPPPPCAVTLTQPSQLQAAFLSKTKA